MKNQSIYLINEKFFDIKYKFHAYADYFGITYDLYLYKHIMFSKILFIEVVIIIVVIIIIIVFHM